MAFELNGRHGLGREVRKVARTQLGKALKALAWRRHAGKARDESVHTARKRLKEVRALLRLVKDGLGKKTFRREIKALRDAARPLSEVRDAAALVGALESLQEHYGGELKRDAFGTVRTALRSRRLAARRRILKKAQVLRSAATAVRKVRGRVERWDLPHGAWKTLQSGLRRAYGRGRKAMAVATEGPTDENLHDWRKRAKDVRYQLELLEPLWPPMMKAAAQQARELSDLLGDDHDLAVLRNLVDGELSGAVAGDVAEVLDALVDRRRSELQTSAASLSEKLFAESPSQFVGRVKAYWKTAAAENGA